MKNNLGHLVGAVETTILIMKKFTNKNTIVQVITKER